MNQQWTKIETFIAGLEGIAQKIERKTQDKFDGIGITTDGFHVTFYNGVKLSIASGVSLHDKLGGATVEVWAWWPSGTPVFRDPRPGLNDEEVAALGRLLANAPEAVYAADIRHIAAEELNDQIDEAFDKYWKEEV